MQNHQPQKKDLEFSALVQRVKARREERLDYAKTLRGDERNAYWKSVQKKINDDYKRIRSGLKKRFAIRSRGEIE